MDSLRYHDIVAVFWLEHYPRSVKGTVKGLALNFPGKKVLCVCACRDLSPERLKMGWQYEEMEGVLFVYLSEEENKQQVVSEILKQTQDAYHFFTGMHPSGIKKFFLPELWESKNVKKVLWAERPTGYPWWRGVLSFIRYVCLARLVNRSTGSKPLILAMGLLGVKAYRRVGFQNVFPFLYHKADVSTEERFPSPRKDVIRFVYVGQFDKRKGVDVLISAFKKLKNEKWSLDLIGANGCYVDEAKRWAMSDSRVRFLGAWKSADVETNLKKYDVCLVPSRYDGWGMVVMEAVQAGIGVITTTRTASRDLIEASGAGVVVKSSSVSDLTGAIDTLLTHPDIVDSWKKKQKCYKKLISDSSINTYVLSLLRWFFEKDKVGPQPECPWIKR